MIPPMLLRPCSVCHGRGRCPIPGLPGLTDCSACSGSGKVAVNLELVTLSEAAEVVPNTQAATPKRNVEQKR